MTIAVTAASGRLGSEIVTALLALDPAPEVVGLARSPEKARHLGIEVRKGDYANPADLAESLRGINTVMLLSGMDAPQDRIPLHRNVINAAKQNGVQKIVYTSIQGAEQETGFSPIVQSNRQTETDVKSSRLDWVIGRNGIYIEADIDYIDTYKEQGNISNCAGEGACGYTTRPELAYAYARMLTTEQHHGKIYNLHGEALTQQQLTDAINQAFGTNLTYRYVPYEQYKQERINELGEFLGTIIAGIYQGIHQGAVNNESHFAEAAGRQHQSWADYFERIKSSRG